MSSAPRRKPGERHRNTPVKSAAKRKARTLASTHGKPGGVPPIKVKGNFAIASLKRKLDRRYFATEEERDRFVSLVEYKPGTHKLNAKGCRIDGRYFPSMAEAVRYLQLKDLAEAGEIERLTCQPRFKVIVNNILVTTYVADFEYDVIDDRHAVLRTVVEDVKGMVMDLYRLKKKLVEVVHGITIHEIKSGQVRQWAGRTG